MLESNTPVAPKTTDLHMTEAHISHNDFWESALLRKRKASDKLFKLKCFHMVISMQWLLKKSTSVFKIASLQSYLEQGIERVASANCKVVHFWDSHVRLLWFYSSFVPTVWIWKLGTWNYPCCAVCKQFISQLLSGLILIVNYHDNYFETVSHNSSMIKLFFFSFTKLINVSHDAHILFLYVISSFHYGVQITFAKLMIKNISIDISKTDLSANCLCLL